MALFDKAKNTFVRVKKKMIPDGLWTKCPGNGEIVYNKLLEEGLMVCPKCDYHFSIDARKRISLLADEGSFEEFDADMKALDPLSFDTPRSYKEKLEEERERTSLMDGVITGRGTINGEETVLCVTDSRFFMGSMGSVLGEKITRAIEKASEKRLPLIIVSGSGGGARMQEGMYSLMQMAKTSAALANYHREGLCYIAVLTNPTMAGVLASFASLGDITIAEPRALIGFTGPRVIEQTIRQRLPENFQRSEFLLEHGFIDMIVHRKDMKAHLGKLLGYFG